jgi:hypothetical protein
MHAPLRRSIRGGSQAAETTTTSAAAQAGRTWWTSVGRRGGLGILVQDDVALMCVTVAVDGDADGARAVAAQQG